ncbi:MAG: hypothetical protein KatS3mg079_657 [Caloramator sp.]|nr:MAG: hypothetical protein KatS3mg079_657 [Caloramator sp.]
MLKDENELNIGDKVEYLQTYDYGRVKTALKNGTIKVVRGKVVGRTKEFVVVETKNYKECFRYYEIGKKLFRRGELNGRLKELISTTKASPSTSN